MGAGATWLARGVHRLHHCIVEPDQTSGIPERKGRGSCLGLLGDQERLENTDEGEKGSVESHKVQRRGRKGLLVLHVLHGRLPLFWMHTTDSTRHPPRQARQLC